MLAMFISSIGWLSEILFFIFFFFYFLENMCYCKQEKKVNKNIIERRPRHDS